MNAEVVPVLIVGAGPVGLATAIELSSHGVASLLIEPRSEASWQRPRAKTVSVRTMEHFRRQGVCEEIGEVPGEHSVGAGVNGGGDMAQVVGIRAPKFLEARLVSVLRHQGVREAGGITRRAPSERARIGDRRPRHGSLEEHESSCPGI